MRRGLQHTVAIAAVVALAAACASDPGEPDAASSPSSPNPPVAGLAGEAVGSDLTIDIAAWRDGIAVADGQGAGGDGRPRLLLATRDAPEVQEVEVPGEPLVEVRLTPTEAHLYVAGLTCPDWSEDVEEDADPFDACRDDFTAVTHRYDPATDQWSEVTATDPDGGDAASYYLWGMVGDWSLGNWGNPDQWGLVWVNAQSGAVQHAAPPAEGTPLQEECWTDGGVVAATAPDVRVRVLRVGGGTWEDVAPGGPSPADGRPIGCSPDGLLWLAGPFTEQAELWELRPVDGALAWTRPSTEGLPDDLSDVDGSSDWTGPTLLWSGPNAPDPGGHDVFVRDGDGQPWRSLGRLAMVDLPQHYATDGEVVVYGLGDELKLLTGG